MRWYLDQIVSNKCGKHDDKAILAGLGILAKLANNIVMSPLEAKFRTLKKSNNAIKAKLMCLDGISEVITAMGYTDVDEDHFVYIGDLFYTLKFGIKLLDSLIETIKLKYMPAEDRSKYLLIKKTTQEFDAKKK
jgi:hypothetical protein